MDHSRSQMPSLALPSRTSGSKSLVEEAKDLSLGDDGQALLPPIPSNNNGQLLVGRGCGVGRLSVRHTAFSYAVIHEQEGEMLSLHALEKDESRGEVFFLRRMCIQPSPGRAICCSRRALGQGQVLIAAAAPDTRAMVLLCASAPSLVPQLLGISWCCSSSTAPDVPQHSRRTPHFPHQLDFTAELGAVWLI